MDENNLNGSTDQNPSQNFGTSAKVFAPPANGQGINAPRDTEKSAPQFHANTYQILENQKPTPVATSPNPAPADSTNVAIANQPATPAVAEMSAPNPAAAPAAATAQVLSKPARVLTLVFAIASAIYFGVVVLYTVANWIASAVNSTVDTMKTIANGVEMHISTAQVISTILVAVLFLCMIVLLWASIRIAKFDKNGLKSWLQASIVAAGVVVFSIVTTLWSWFQLKSALGFMGSYNSAILDQLFAAVIRNAVVQFAVPFAFFIAGWIILTRPKVRAWFL